MSWVNIKRRKSPAVTAFKRVMCLFAGIVLAVGTFSILDGDGYLFLLQQNTTVGAMISTMVTTVKDTLGITSGSGNGSGTVGSSGINTLMISKMQEGYAKDYLEICLKNEAGELDTTKRKVYASLGTIVGTNFTETGFYSHNDCKYTLPQSDIPASIVFSKTYGTGNNTLYKWSSATASSHNSELPACGGAFAYTPGVGLVEDGWTGLSTKSIYNKGSSTPKGVGDALLMPDAVCGLNGFLNSGISDLELSANTLNRSAYSDTIKAMITIFTHNAGSGFNKAMYGVCHFAKNKIGAQNQKETIERMETYVDDMVKSTSKMSDKNINSMLNHLDNNHSLAAAAAALTQQGWSISPEMYTRLTGDSITIDNVTYPGGTNHTDSSKAAWAWVTGEKEMSASEFRNELKKHVSTLPKITGYSPSECDSIYGTSDGSYSKGILKINSDYESQAGYGTAFKLLDGTTDALKGKKGAKRVIAMPGIGLIKTFSVTGFSQKIAARMMIYAGIDAADVYITSGDSGQTTAGGSSSSGSSGTFTANTKIIDKLKSHGCDVSKLTENNYAILKSADRADGKAYVWASSHGHGYCTKVHDSYDCSSFISHAIAGSGIDGVKEGMKGFPDSTKTYPSQSNSKFNMKPPGSWKTSELYPGDIFTDIGHHTCMFVGIKNGNICTIEAYCEKYGCGYFNHPNRNGYGVYRLKTIHNPDHF